MEGRGEGPESEYSFRLGTVEAPSSSGSGGVASEMALSWGFRSKQENDVKIRSQEQGEIQAEAQT